MQRAIGSEMSAASASPKHTRIKGDELKLKTYQENPTQTIYSAPGRDYVHEATRRCRRTYARRQIDTTQGRTTTTT